MKLWQDCPKHLSKDTSYYCHRLQIMRDGREEAMCQVCRRFEEACLQTTELREALAFAEEAHKGQVRKGTKIPYVIHLLRTWWYVQQMTEDKEEQQAAILHDILEDTKVTPYELRERFGNRVFDLVAGESEYKREGQPPGETWKIRKSETIARMERRIGEKAECSAMHIAFGDKLANLYSMWFEYRVVGEKLWEKFNQKDKAMHAWYYRELGKNFEQYFLGREENCLMKEYRTYFREVFGYEI